jgi:hypothetical protein
MMTDMCHWGTRYLRIPPNLPMIRKAMIRKASTRSKSRPRKSFAA